MKRIGRRRFLKTSLSGLALVTLPRISFAQSDPDVVVIGAGAAGLAATAELMKKGKSVVCIEAMNRIGGRCYTDNSIFGVPYDMGAHWLECADGSPFVKYAKKNEKFKIWPNSYDADQVYDGMSETSGDLWEIYKIIDRIKYNTKKDVALLGQLSEKLKARDWFDTAHLISGPYGMARDFNNWSCYDDYHWKGPKGSGFCKQGYGALVADYRKDVPVKLKTVAKEIKWDKKGVKVVTNDGTISAKACIVTVSTGVLNARKIKFTPDLPDYKYDAFAGITMGTYNHITFLFDKRYLFKIGIKYPDTYVYTKIQSNAAPSPKGGCGLFNITGSGLCYWDTGGKFSEELEAEGSKAQIDFFLNNLKTTFGSEIDKHVIKAHATRWGKNPFTLGSYAGAIPGKAHLRKSLRKSVGKIFFAGEACADAHATVYGANWSGVRVGKKVGKKV
jgi:monoamine oxidase